MPFDSCPVEGYLLLRPRGVELMFKLGGRAGSNHLLGGSRPISVRKNHGKSLKNLKT